MPRPTSSPMTPEQRRQRARIAARLRHAPDDPTLDDDRRELGTARLIDHIVAVLAAAPTLTDAQRERAAAVLRAPSHSETA